LPRLPTFKASHPTVMFKRKQKHIIKCALHRRTGDAVHIDKADNGLKCGCYCSVCDKDFVVVQGRSVGHREWHFRHEGDRDNSSTCPGGVETALHKLAKQILVSSSSIVLPKFGSIAYSDPVAEIKHISTRPDVTITYKDQPAYFEVAVYHFIEPLKEAFFTSGQYRSVEINLSKLDPLASLTVVEEAVLRNVYNKRVIFWETEPVIVKPTIVIPEPVAKIYPSASAKQVLVLEPKEEVWDKIIRFIKERPGEALALLIAGVIFIPRIIRYLYRKIF